MKFALVRTNFTEEWSPQTNYPELYKRFKDRITELSDDVVLPKDSEHALVPMRRLKYVIELKNLGELIKLAELTSGEIVVDKHRVIEIYDDWRE